MQATTPVAVVELQAKDLPAHCPNAGHAVMVFTPACLP